MSIKPVKYEKQHMGKLFKDSVIMYRWNVEIEEEMYQIELQFKKYVIVFKFVLKINNKVFAKQTCFGGLNKRFRLKNTRFHLIKELDKPCKLLIDGLDFCELETQASMSQESQTDNKQNKTFKSDPNTHQVQRILEQKNFDKQNSMYENSNVYFPSGVKILQTQDQNVRGTRMPVQRLFNQIHEQFIEMNFLFCTEDQSFLLFKIIYSKFTMQQGTLEEIFQITISSKNYENLLSLLQKSSALSDEAPQLNLCVKKKDNSTHLTYTASQQEIQNYQPSQFYQYNNSKSSLIHSLREFN